MTRRTSRLPLVSVLWVALAPVVAVAQMAPRAEFSPVSPPTLKAPVFDTVTPEYSASAAEAKSARTVVAEVDGRAITLGDVADAIRDLPPRMQNLRFEDVFPSVVDQLIRTQALAIRAQHQGLDEDEVVRRRMKAASDHVLANEILRAEASRTITEKALLEHYDRDVAGKPGPEEAHISVIMVPSEAAAQGIIGELRQGAEFGNLAKRSSKDASASSGGDLGFVTRDALTPEVAALAFATASGQVASAPVKSGESWFVIKTDEKRRRPAPPFSVVRAQLEQAMIREIVPDIVGRALSSVTVRQYSISGKETGDGPTERASTN